MPSNVIERDDDLFHRGVEKLKAEVAVLQTGFTGLEQQNLRSSSLVQKLGRFWGFGAAGKLEWAKLKLNWKQEELGSFKTQFATAEATADRSTVSAGRV